VTLLNLRHNPPRITWHYGFLAVVNHEIEVSKNDPADQRILAAWLDDGRMSPVPAAQFNPHILDIGRLTRRRFGFTTMAVPSVGTPSCVATFCGRTR
jgi:hypothetical protein